MPSLLVTNDFPPKFGGIQSYLYELWRRLPPEQTTVLTTPHAGARAWDRAQRFRVERTREPVLLPNPLLARRIDALAREVGAGIVFLDPALPLGLLGPSLTAAPWVVILHGAEVTVPGRLPGSRRALARVLRGAAGVVAAGAYPAREAVHAARTPLAGLVIPPGVDTNRFTPATSDDHRRSERVVFGLDPDRRTVVAVSRLVPRKGFDVLLDAVAMLELDVQLAIAGAGRDRRRLEARAHRLGLDERVRFLGRVPDDALPALYRAGDVFAMVCRERWGGLEAEGFGIVFLEAAASGVPAIAGRSGCSHEAVIDGTTGFVVDPDDVTILAQSLERILVDPEVRDRMGAAARDWAVECSYDARVAQLAPLAAGDLSVLAPL
ncbi:MAG: glycosyltransferase family 4 protein [Acidimicrobiia bacterium]